MMYLVGADPFQNQPSPLLFVPSTVTGWTLPLQSRVLFNIFPVLRQGGRADELNFPLGKETVSGYWKHPGTLGAARTRQMV